MPRNSSVVLCTSIYSNLKLWKLTMLINWTMDFQGKISLGKKESYSARWICCVSGMRIIAWTPSKWHVVKYLMSTLNSYALHLLTKPLDNFILFTKYLLGVWIYLLTIMWEVFLLHPVCRVWQKHLPYNGKISYMKTPLPLLKWLPE